MGSLQYIFDKLYYGLVQLLRHSIENGAAQKVYLVSAWMTMLTYKFLEYDGWGESEEIGFGLHFYGVLQFVGYCI